MQPTYMPWVGYFDLMDSVDRFVFLDNVQFEKRSWQQRNRIKTAQGLQIITVPVKSKARFDQRIDAVELLDASFLDLHLRSIENAYRRAPFFARYFPPFAEKLRSGVESGRLADFTIHLISWIAEMLGITTALVRASSLSATGKRTALLASICASIGAGSYISPAGSLDYLADERADMENKGIEIHVQDFVHPEYAQLYPPFLSHASAIDILFNCGPDSLPLIRSGRRPPTPLLERIGQA